MNFESEIKSIVDSFAPITLKEMDDVCLMRRVDMKFVFNTSLLPALLKKAAINYYVLDINQVREQVYETTYYDTNEYAMYNLHHNGKQNRYKVRVRKYVSSDMGFLEVKRKTNKGETIKNRIVCPAPYHDIDFDGSSKFLQKFTPYDEQILWPKLSNRFIRITLVNKDRSERITIDYKLIFKDLKYHEQIIPSNLCIAEIKRNRDSQKSSFLNTLNELHIKPSGFSKYCVGLAMLNPEVKTNLFKQKIRALYRL
ncbi:MAG TPA: polyphosphate polymerase domain-containing protein [Prolixibacteraceae bacterium]|nr:polyphosphate polymerase domain-containing protein [Prolixibacteraceae bacterium]HPS11760.1 polyphosphate polymerase domain-containing protein [Prolixibacteraceae bacterium]